MEIMRTVPGKRGRLANAAYVLLLGITVFHLLAFFMTAGYGFFLIFLMVGVLWYVTLFRARYEYDYLFWPEEKEFEIARITNKRKRKRICGFYMDEVLLVARLGSEAARMYQGRVDKVYDCTPAEAHSAVYEVYVSKGSRIVNIQFEPDACLLEAMALAAPQKVVK